MFSVSFILKETFQLYRRVVLKPKIEILRWKPPPPPPPPPTTTTTTTIIIIIIIDRDETINHIISECSKLAQREYKTRHDRVGKVIHWEKCKKFKFYHTNKWHMHSPAPVLENDIQTSMGRWHTNGSPNLGQKTRPYNNQQKKKKTFAKLSTLLSQLTTE